MVQERFVFFSLTDASGKYLEEGVNIYSVNADGSGMTPLTDGPAADKSPALSPDGRQIVFISRRDGDESLYLMNSDGTQPRRLLDADLVCTMPRFSPDGKQIVFKGSDREKTNGSHFYLVNPDGTHLVQVVEAENKFSPVFSGDGQSILYHRAGFLEIVGVDGSNPRRLFDGTPWEQTSTYPGVMRLADHHYGAIALHPDGKRIAFHQSFFHPIPGDLHYTYRIMLAELDGSELVALTEQFESAYYPTFSPNGKWLAFVRGDPRTVRGVRPKDRIVVMPLDGSEQMPVSDGSFFPYSLSWGPIAD